MQLPTIHINGTSTSELLDGYMDAMDALLTAINALEQRPPNARDYYISEGADFHEAFAEHKNRVATIVAVRREINQLAEHVADNTA